MSEHGNDVSARQSGPPPPASLRDLADLARTGSVIQRQPLMQVTFEVHHVVDRPGYLADYVGAPALESERQAPGPAAPTEPDQDAPRENALSSDEGIHAVTRGPATNFGETLTSSAYGLGLVIVTKTSVGVGSRRRFTSVSRTQYEVEDMAGDRVYRGTARPNPSFLYESAWRYEGLISIQGDAAGVTEGASQEIREIIREIARVANKFKAPILSLQAPAQVPLSDKEMRAVLREEDLLPEAAFPAVRFSIALQRPDAAVLLAISGELEEFCAEKFGFWLEDTRLGSRPGNWFEICPPPAQDSGRSQARKSGNQLVMHCLPVTLVGPARVESAHALMVFLGQEAGVAACSITSLDDLLFVHFELNFPGISAAGLSTAGSLPEEGREADEKPAPPVLAYDIMRRMFATLGYQSAERWGEDELVKHAGDYQCFIGPRRPVRNDDGARRMAIWFSWQTQGVEPDLALPLGGLFGALADVGLLTGRTEGRSWSSEAPNIDYLICRNVGNSILRGKGKLSVPQSLALASYPSSGLESRPTNLCVAIEEAWRARIARDGRHGIRELTVGWRECWLGHWSLPL
jgi:hypothetical protein